MNPKPALRLLVLIIGLALCGGGLWTLLRPAEYRATAQIEIQPGAMPDVPEDHSYNPYFYETELKAIQSDAVLSNVVEALDLNVEWGKRYGGGEKLETSDAIEKLRQHLGLDVVQNTKLVDISVWDIDAGEAARIANAIADAYVKYCHERYQDQWENGVKLLEKQYQEEEAQIQIMQSNVDQLRGKLLNSDRNDTDYASMPTPIIAPEQVEHYNKLLIEGWASYVKLTNELTELQSVQTTNPAAIPDILLAIHSDNTLSDLLNQLHEKERQLAVETNSMTFNNPDVVQTRATIQELHRQIDDRVKGFMMGLKDNIDSQKAALDALRDEIKNAEAELARTKPYWDAKAQLQDKLELHELFGESIYSDKHVTLPGVPAAIINIAVAPSVPERPNRWLGAVMLACGLAISGFGLCSLRNGGIAKVKP